MAKPLTISCHSPHTIPPDRFAMIIGAMKAGTSTLFSLIAQHPAICGCSTKEPEYFSSKQRHRTATHRYDDLWRFDPARHAFALEASTGYTKFPMEQGVPERMKQAGLNPRFIYILRDPLERVESHYNFVAMRGRTMDLLGDFPTAVSSYHRQLEQFARVYGRDRILLLNFEELLADSQAVCDRVFRFLGLESHQVRRVPEARNESRFSSRLEAWFARREMHWLARTLPKPLVRGLVRATRQRRRRLSRREREVLRTRLAPDMHRLHENYGVDVRRWGF